MSLTANQLTIINNLTQERADGAALRDSFRGNDEAALAAIAGYIPGKISELQYSIAQAQNIINVSNAQIASAQALLDILQAEQLQ